MAAIQEKDWNHINSILVEIYSMDDMKDIASKLLKLMRLLVNYSQAYFIVFDEDGEIDQKVSAFEGINRPKQLRYMEYFYKMDYVNYICDFSKTKVFRDTDILEESVRQQTPFYKEYMKPQGIPYGGGLVLAKHGKILGILNFFRSEETGDVTDRELRILEIIKDHLINILASSMSNSGTIDGSKSWSMKELEKYQLSKREEDVLNCLMDGATNIEIAQDLCIAESTVKKHVYNIFTKLGVNSRMQLIQLVDHK